MSRLIDADALLEGREDHEMISTHLIWNAPTIHAVEVVRCEDCQWYDTTHPCGTMFPNSFFCKFYRTFNPQSHFCAAGIRTEPSSTEWLRFFHMMSRMLNRINEGGTMHWMLSQMNLAH